MSINKVSPSTFTTGVLICDTVHYPGGSSDALQTLTVNDGSPVDAALEIKSTSGALLIPRVTTAQRDLMNSVDGMFVYNTDDEVFNFRESGSWTFLPPGGIVTFVGTGAGLTGGPITTTGTISISLVTPDLGGTGLTSYSQGDILYASGPTTISVLSKNTSATRYLSNTGASNNPGWAQIDLTNGVTGILPNSNTTASSLNTAVTIVARDVLGNFSAGTITAALSGNSTTSTTLQTARLINGVSFNGSSNITITADPVGAAGGDLTGTYPNPTIANLSITNAMIANGTIDLTSKVTGILPNSNTTADSANTASAIVVRDSSGNFSASTITSALSGNSTTATTLQTARLINGISFNGSADITITAVPSGSAGGSLTGTYPNPTIANLAVTNSMIANSTIDLTAKVTGILPNANTTADSANTSSAIVTRDASGNFSAGTITASLSGNSTTATTLQTARAIYGNNFDGSAALTQIIASTYGGTGNGFTKFSGAATSEKTYTLPNASCTILTTNAAVTEVQGGTNQTTYATGDILYASVANTLSKLTGNTTTSKQYLSQTGTGSASQAPAWASISGVDITGSALTASNDTNVTLTLGGTPATSLLRAASITAGWTGTLSAARGGVGTDSSAWSQGDLVYISATGTWNHLAKNTTATRYLANTGTSNNPQWDQINLANGVTGILANANTTAASTNTASTIVARDSSGNFSAGTITASLSGNATTATTATNVTITNDTTTNATVYPTWATGTGGNPLNITTTSFGLNPSQGTVIFGAPDFLPYALTDSVYYSSTAHRTRIAMTGKDYPGYYTDHDGIGITMGLNGPGAKEFWFIDTIYSDPGSTELALQFGVYNPSNICFVSAISTDRSTQLPIRFGNNTAQTTLSGGPITIDTSGVSVSQLLATDSSSDLVSISYGSANTASSIVERDSSGNFSAGTITAALSGNATTATTLQTARLINGVSFNGSADITITAAPSGSAGGSLTGTYPNPTIANLAVTNAMIANSTIDLTTKVTGVLPSSNGGTGVNNSFNLTVGAASSINQDVTTSGTPTFSSLTATHNINANNFVASVTSTVSAGATTNLNQNSTQIQTLTGTLNQIYKLPNGNILSLGWTFQFDNNSTGTLTVNDSTNSLVVTVPAGGYARVSLTNTTAPGTWDHHEFLPANTSWGTSTLDTPATITSATWNGSVIANVYTTATSANTASAIVARDSSGNFSAGTITATLSGNASTATTATNATNIAITDDTTTNATMYPIWVTSTSSNLPAKVSSTKITFNPSTANLTTTTFTGALSGNANTATTLQTARAIYGNNFDGSAALNQIIASTYGGTGNGFTKFSGAATSEKTYTLPNASCTILTTNAAVTETQGGTNQTTYATGDTLYASAANTLSKLTGNITTGKQYLSQTGTGTASQAPSWASIAGSDITGAALTAGNDTNVTLTLGGTPATSLLRAASITAGWSGTLSAARGGTGLDSSAWAQGDLVYISATGTWNHLAKNTTATRYLANTGTSNNPAWDQINLANGVTGTLANSNTTATSANTGSTIVARDSNGAFSMGALTLYDSGISTNGTAGVLLVNGAGSTTNAGATANFSSGNSSTAAKIYGIAVEKFGTEILYMGVNKNTTTDSVPASTCFISTYQSTGKLSIGRGGSNSLPSTSDILLNGDGSVTFAGSIGIGVTPINSTLTFNNSTSSPFPRLVLYSIANNDHQYLGYGISANTLRYQVPDNVTDHVFFAATSSSASNELLRVKGGGDVQASTGNLIINTAGKTLKIKQGSNACAGTGATMAAGSVTVNTTAVATGDIVLTSKTASAGTLGSGEPTVSIVNGTSFTLTSSSALETSTYSWVIIKAA